MALNRTGITLGNDYVVQMRQCANEFSSISSEIISSLNSNGNFQIFREGTEKGDNIYKNMNVCVDTIVGQLVPTIHKIANTTAFLLDQQDNLNKADNQQNVDMMR